MPSNDIDLLSSQVPVEDSRSQRSQRLRRFPLVWAYSKEDHMASTVAIFLMCLGSDRVCPWIFERDLWCSTLPSVSWCSGCCHTMKTTMFDSRDVAAKSPIDMRARKTLKMKRVKMRGIGGDRLAAVPRMFAVPKMSEWFWCGTLLLHSSSATARIRVGSPHTRKRSGRWP